MGFYQKVREQTKEGENNAVFTVGSLFAHTRLNNLFPFVAQDTSANLQADGAASVSMAGAGCEMNINGGGGGTLQEHIAR